MPLGKVREAYDQPYAYTMPKTAFVKDAELLDDHVSLKYWLDDASMQKLQQETLNKLNNGDTAKPYGSAWPEAKKLSNDVINALRDVNIELDTVAEGKLHLETDTKKRLAYVQNENKQLYHDHALKQLSVLNQRMFSDDENPLPLNQAILDAAWDIKSKNHMLVRELAESLCDYEKTRGSI